MIKMNRIVIAMIITDTSITIPNKVANPPAKFIAQEAPNIRPMMMRKIIKAANVYNTTTSLSTPAL